MKKRFEKRVRLVVYLDESDYKELKGHAGKLSVSFLVRDILLQEMGTWNGQEAMRPPPEATPEEKQKAIEEIKAAILLKGFPA